jgi:hypothetical protein
MKLVVISALAGIGKLVVSGCASSAPASSPAQPATVTVTASASQPAASQSAATQPAASQSAAAAPVPGHATPEEAVAGVFQDERSGNLAHSCTYLEPATQASCNQAASQVSAPPIVSGQVRIVGAVISGRYALVQVTGDTCSSSNVCVHNSNPDFDMPVGSGTFMATYNKLLNTIGDTLSPVPCVRVSNRWYVNEEQ